MKKMPVKETDLLLALILFLCGLSFANADNNTTDNMLLPLPYKGKYAKLDVSSLPENQYITVRIRDKTDRLVEEFKVKNTGQNFVLINFTRLNPGIYSLNVIRNQNEVVRKILDVHWDKVLVDNVALLSEERRRETRWPFMLN